MITFFLDWVNSIGGRIGATGNDVINIFATKLVGVFKNGFHKFNSSFDTLFLKL